MDIAECDFFSSGYDLDTTDFEVLPAVENATSSCMISSNDEEDDEDDDDDSSAADFMSSFSYFLSALMNLFGWKRIMKNEGTETEDLDDVNIFPWSSSVKGDKTCYDGDNGKTSSYDGDNEESECDTAPGEEDNTVPNEEETIIDLQED